MVVPNGMTLQEWADATAYVLHQYDVGSIEGDDWRRWGVALTCDPRLARLNLPSPGQYERWQEWARVLNQALAGLGQ